MGVPSISFERGDIVEIKRSHFDPKTGNVMGAWQQAIVTHATRYATNISLSDKTHLAIPAGANWIRKKELT